MRSIVTDGRRRVAAASVLAAAMWVNTPAHQSDSAEPRPQLLGPGIISTGGFESHPAFLPDGRTLYFVKSTPSFSFWTICVSQKAGSAWQAPQVAPFSGRYSDADPFVAADGRTLYFISTRPAKGTGEAKDLDIWQVDRRPGGWSEPRPVEGVNSSDAEWFPTIARDGTMYFGSDRAGGQGRTDLYRARVSNGRYAVPENLGPVVNSAGQEFEPYIDPDQRFLIFMGARAGGQGGTDLYVTYHEAGTWSAPVNLGPRINSAGSEYSPGFSPDGRMFLYASTRQTIEPGRRPLSFRELTRLLEGPGNGLGDIYQVDVAALGLRVAR